MTSSPTLKLKLYGPAARKRGDVADVDISDIGFVGSLYEQMHAYVISEEQGFVIADCGDIESVKLLLPSFINVMSEHNQFLVNPEFVENIVPSVRGPQFCTLVFKGMGVVLDSTGDLNTERAKFKLPPVAVAPAVSSGSLEAAP